MFLRRKTAGLMLAAAAAIGLTTAAALPASASAPNYFSIIVQVGTYAPVYCLQPADPAGGAGTAIVQEPCVIGNQAQHWAPVNIGGSSYEFLNQASGECLDARGGAARGTPVQQWPCNTISNERWSWSYNFPNGFWPIDFGGALGEPATRWIETKLPWLNSADNPAAVALRAAGLPIGDGPDPKQAFTRK